MAKLIRKTQKVFGQNGQTNQFAVFGTMKRVDENQQPDYSKDIEEIQSNNAYLQGWQAAVIANYAPFLEELNSICYSLTYQMSYLLQSGIPEWDDGTTYYAGSKVTGSDGFIYNCLTDDCLNVDPTTDDGTNWFEYNFIPVASPNLLGGIKIGSGLSATSDGTTSVIGKANTSLDNVTNTSGFRKLIEAKVNGLSGYKIFREYDATTGNYVGLWCEEWGETNGISGERNIGFTNTFKDTNYNASFCWGLQTTFNTNNIAIQNFSLVNANARGFLIRTGVTTIPIRWKVEGYLAESEE